MQIREAAKERNRQSTWYVTSETDSAVTYIVHNKRNVVSHHKVWTCNCPDFTERQQFKNGQCKHITEVKNKIALDAVTAEVLGDKLTLPTVNQVIDTIVRVLNGPRDQAKQLWDVLTVLRGPDNDDSELKAITTAPLRGAIGIRPGASGAIVNNKQPFAANLDVTEGGQDWYAMLDTLAKKHNAQDHFGTHYRAALNTLKRLGYVK